MRPLRGVGENRGRAPPPAQSHSEMRFIVCLQSIVTGAGMRGLVVCAAYASNPNKSQRCQCEMTQLRLSKVPSVRLLYNFRKVEPIN